MSNSFKRKNMWWIVIVCICVLVVAAVLYSVLKGNSDVNQEAQRGQTDIDENSMYGESSQFETNRPHMDADGVEAGAADLSSMAQEGAEVGAGMMDEAVVSGLVHGDEYTGMDVGTDADINTDIDIDTDINIADILKDKTLSILGDSISTYEGWIPDGYVDFFPMYGEVEDVDETWWKMLMDDAGLQFCANSSSAGSTCVGDSLSIDDPKFACSNYRIDDLIGKGGIYPDVIIVYMGTNDCLTNVPIGENDGTQFVEEGDIDNFSDAYTLILDKLESQYPGAWIFCCTLTQIGAWGSGNKPFVNFVNSSGLTSEDYSRKIEKIAANRGLNVIDLNNCGIDEGNMQKYVTDGVHLNPDGMKLVRDAVEAAIAASSY